MMWVSCATVSVLPTVVSAGTYGETPPSPCGPWHCEHANWTKVCAPAATTGLTEAPATGCVAPATDTVVVCDRQFPTPNPTATPAATIATAATAIAGPTQVFWPFPACSVFSSSIALLRRARGILRRMSGRSASHIGRKPQATGALVLESAGAADPASLRHAARRRGRARRRARAPSAAAARRVADVARSRARRAAVPARRRAARGARAARLAGDDRRRAAGAADPGRRRRPAPAGDRRGRRRARAARHRRPATRRSSSPAASPGARRSGSSGRS